ncbi:MAG: hypothetical protein JRN06_09250 [Nitrososphaerota archaeon]|nr:hypothetical protein [Nitrososphaerota archaeon]MDG7024771.1 hypothetical protein [Nitrososphaerota archaeon]
MSRVGLAAAVIALILVILVAGAGALTYFMLFANHGTGTPSSATTTAGTSSTGAQSSIGSTSSSSSSTAYSSTVSSSTNSQSNGPYGSVVSSLILYNNTLKAGAPEISDATFTGNYSTIAILDTIYDPSNENLYVSGLNSSANPLDPDIVLVVSTTTNRVVADIQLADGAAPTQMTFDSSNGYIYGTAPSTAAANITVIDANTNTALPNFTPPGKGCGSYYFSECTASGIAYDSNANVLYTGYCCDFQGNDYLVTIDPSTQTAAGTLVLPHYMVFGNMMYDSANQLLYITSDTSAYGNVLGNVTVIQPGTDTILKVIPIGDPSEWSTFAVNSPGGPNQEIFVACEGNISVIDAQSNAVVQTINLPKTASGIPPSMMVGVAYDSKDGLLYVTIGLEPEEVLVFSNSFTLVGTIATNIPTYSIAFAASSGEVYVGDLSFGVIDIIS